MPVVPCAPSAPVFGIVNYLASEFLTSYPEFTGVNNMAPQALANDFVGATFLLNNTCCSRVCDANQRLYLLYLLTAHIAAIQQGVNDAGIGSPFFSGAGSITGTVLTVTQVNKGVLAIGASLYDSPIGAIIPGTIVTAQTSGTPGGVGVYTVNISQTVAFFSGTASQALGVVTIASTVSGYLAVGNVLGGSGVQPGSIITSFGTYTVLSGVGTVNVSTSGTIALGTATVASENFIVPGVPNIVPPVGIVGRINNASEGDVSVAAEWAAPPNANQAYFVQTKYGAQYWTMTARYRTAIFVPAPIGAYDPLAGYGLGPWGFGGPNGY